MTHEQLQAAQRAALSLGLNINSEQAAAIINAALRMQQEADPVAYVLFRDREVFYETDDNIVISNKPGDSSDLYQWLPVYTAPAALQPDDLTHCACGDAYPATSYGAGFIDGSGMCPNCDAAIPARDIHTPAVSDVLAERQRQVDTEGWTPEHDDEHSDGQMARAAGCYAQYAHGAHLRSRGFWPTFWPWHRAWWKPCAPRRMLVKAGALILAEIERLDRAAPAPQHRTYTTQPGESLAGIALRQLKDETRWVEIRDLNARPFPDMGPHNYYPVGTVLDMPELRGDKSNG